MDSGESFVTVRLWASAKAAAGVGEVTLPTTDAITLAAVRERVLALRPDADRLSAVLDVCSVLVDDRPAGTVTWEEIAVDPGSSVDFLPPFAGG